MMAVKRNKSRKAETKITHQALTPLQAALLTEAERTVTITSDGRQQEVSIVQVVSRKLLQMAANGSVHALSNAVNEIILAQRLQQREIEEEVEFGHRLKERQEQRLAQARAAGHDENSVLPHPDDIAVIPGIGCRVRGSRDEAELKIILATCARRDVLILQAALEERLVGPENGIQTSPSTGQQSGSDHPGSTRSSAGGSALLRAQFLNHGLPARFEKSNTEIAFDLMRHARMSKRELLKATHQAWASIGSRKPRGWITAPHKETVARLEQVTEDCADLWREIAAGKLTSDWAIAERLREIARDARETASRALT